MWVDCVILWVVTGLTIGSVGAVGAVESIEEGVEDIGGCYFGGLVDVIIGLVESYCLGIDEGGTVYY